MFNEIDNHQTYIYILKGLSMLVTSCFISYSITTFLKNIGYPQTLNFRLNLIWALFTITTYIAILVSLLLH